MYGKHARTQRAGYRVLGLTDNVHEIVAYHKTRNTFWTLFEGCVVSAEIGLAGAESTSWGAVLAPAGTPAPAIARMNAVLREAAAQPAVRERMAAAGADAAASTPEELVTRMGRENERWARVVREANITIN